MDKKSNLNDGSQNVPGLEVHQSWWAMTAIGDAVGEWTTEKKFAKIAEEGFSGILGDLPKAEETAEWRRLLDYYHLSFGVTCFPRTPGDLDEVLERAQAFGVDYLNLQVLDNFVIGDEALTLLTNLLEVGAKFELPLFIETHRGRITQDLQRTVEYAQALPQLKLTLDLSHYVVAGEMYFRSDKSEELFDILLRRTASLHGRISNGAQIQVDIGPNGEHPLVKRYLEWWTKGMGYWLKAAQPGDVLPFVTELGPWPYAIVQQDYNKARREEISDRWQQSLVFKRLAEKAWEEANRAANG